MKDLTQDRPKCLIELHGKSLLDRQIKALQEAGITDIGIVTGYKRELLADRGLIEFHNPRWQQTNMVSSLETAKVWLESDTCIISYSDIFYDSSAVISLINSPASIAITYDPNWLQLWQRRFGDPLKDAETFRLTTEGMLAEIGNKPNSIEEIQGQYMGLLRFTPKGWGEVERIRSLVTGEVRDSMHMTATLQRLIDAQSVKISAIPYSGSWGEVDSAEDLSCYN
jgi:choline kinase